MQITAVGLCLAKNVFQAHGIDAKGKVVGRRRLRRARVRALFAGLKPCLIRQRTMLVNALRAHLAELGTIAPQGREMVEDLITVIEHGENKSIPALAKAALTPLVARLRAAEQAIAGADAEIMAWHTGNEASRRLETIPGVGFRTASAIVATVPDPRIPSGPAARRRVNRPDT